MGSFAKKVEIDDETGEFRASKSGQKVEAVGLVSSEKLTIQDTEFILRKMMECSYDGTEIMPAAKTIEKVTAIHKQLLEVVIDAS